MSQFRYIHFATHGLLNSTHPELSGLVLPAADRAILLAYHQEQGRTTIANRLVLAHQLSVTIGSLRNRACRIRERMAECIRACSQRER